MDLTIDERLKRLERAVAELAEKIGGVQAGSELSSLKKEYRDDHPEPRQGRAV